MAITVNLNGAGAGESTSQVLCCGLPLASLIALRAGAEPHRGTWGEGQSSRGTATITHRSRRRAAAGSDLLLAGQSYIAARQVPRAGHNRGSKRPASRAASGATAVAFSVVAGRLG